MYKKLIPESYIFIFALAAFFVVSPAPAKASTEISGGYISTTTSWTLSDSPVIITGTVTVIADTVLAISPGVEVRFNASADLIVSGSLQVWGNDSDPVIFTSNANITPGAWGHIYLQSSSENNIIDHAVIEYSQSLAVYSSDSAITNSRFQNNITGLAILGSSPEISDNIFENNTTAISINYGSPSITNNTITGGNTGLSISGAQNPVITDNAINTADWPIRIDPQSGHLDFSNNILLGPKQGIYVNSGYVSYDVIFSALGYPYIISNIPPINTGPYARGVFIANGATLTINPGTILKFEPGSSLTVGRRYSGGIEDSPGTLIAVGTEQNKIVFTSIHDDLYGGDTMSDGNATTPTIPGQTSQDYLYFSALSRNSVVDHAVIRYRNRLYAFTPSLIIKNTLFEKNNVGATVISASPVFIGNAFKNNTYGLTATQGNPIIFFNEFHNNAIQNIYIDPSAHPILSSPDPYKYTYDNNTHRSKLGNYWSGYTDADADNDGIGDTAYVVANGQDDYPLMVGINSYTEISTSTRNPVIIVPGVIASYLRNRDANKEVWPNFLEMFTSNNDEYLDELILPVSGAPYELNIEPYDIFRKVSDYDFFQGLITELENNGYEEENDLFVFPYDWRLDIDYLSGHGAADNPDTLSNKIQYVLEQTHASKVDIIAHSMGGLIAKRYVQVFGASLVDKFIDIATPHLGSPKTFKILACGDDLDMKKLTFGLNTERVMTISQNFPSIYQILPSALYFDPLDVDYNAYIADIHDIDNNGIKGNLDYGQSLALMVNKGRNYDLLISNETLHGAIDNYSPQTEGVPTYNIVGCGQATLGKILVLNKEKSGRYSYGLKYIEGDSTVPLKSAEYLISKKVYYVNNTEHAYLSSANGVRQLVASILKGEQDDFDLAAYTNLNDNKNICSFSGAQIEFHSPIDLHVYDSVGNHLGPDVNGDIETGIDGAQYDIIEDNKFVFLPGGGSYTVVGRASEQGTFSAHARKISDGIYGETIYWDEILLSTPSTNIEIDVYDNQTGYIMQIDQDGDDVFEEQKEPDAILDTEEAQDVDKPQTDIIVSGTKGNNDWYVSGVQVEFDAHDNEGGSGVLKTEYSLDGGNNWEKYEEPFNINNDGTTTVIYQSTDRAGNIEITKERLIKIDRSGPEIEIIFPYEGQEFYRADILQIIYGASDSISGIAGASLSVDGNQIATASLELLDFSLGEHKLEIKIIDLAGNASSLEIKFNIVTDIDSTINDINELYDQGEIYKEAVKKTLISQLEWIKKYEEHYGQRENKRNEQQEKAMAKCVLKKGHDWCAKYLEKNLDKINYHLNLIHKKIVEIKYKAALKLLEIYHNKKWLSDYAYATIREDINFLLNNL